MAKVHIALFSNGYPYVDAAIRALDLSHRHQATFSRSVGEPYSLRREQLVQWFLGTDATHALMLEGDVVPPEDALGRLLEVGASVATAVYPQWLDDRLCANVMPLNASTWPATIVAERFPVRRCLLGCVLVTREAFKAIPAPCFLSTVTAKGFLSDDEWFCEAVRRAGHSIVCDGSIMCAAYRQGTDLRAVPGGALRRS